jgi:Zn-dependent protease with chaperone function
MKARVRAALAVLVLLGTLLLVVLLVAALATAVVRTVTTGSTVGVLAAVVLGIVLAALVVVLVKVLRTRPRPPEGVVISPVEEPELWRMVRDAAAGVGAEEPDEVRLVAGPVAGVTEDARIAGLVPGTRVLHVGVPLLQTFTRAQLQWVLVHELGHFSDRHTPLSGIARRGLVSLTLLADGLGPAHPLRRPLRAYVTRYARAVHAVWRDQELDADRWASVLAGPETGAAALRALGTTTTSWATFTRDYATLGREVGMVPRGVYPGFASFLSDLDRPLPDADRAVADQPDDPLDPHPSVATRIELLEAMQLQVPDSLGSDGDPALLVLTDPGSTILAVEALARDASLTAVSWDRAVTFGNRRRDEERAVAAMAAVEQLVSGHADLSRAVQLAADERGRALAELIADRELEGGLAALASGLDDDSVREVLRHALEVLVRSALVGTGHAAYVLRWDRPDVIVDEALVEVDVAGLVAGVPGDPAAAEWLLRVLRDEGVSHAWHPSVSVAMLGPAGPSVLAVLVPARTWTGVQPVVMLTEAGLAVRRLGVGRQLRIGSFGPQTSPEDVLSHAVRIDGLSLLTDAGTELVPWTEVEQVAYAGGERPQLTYRREGRATSYRVVALAGDPQRALDVLVADHRAEGVAHREPAAEADPEPMTEVDAPVRMGRTGPLAQAELDSETPSESFSRLGTTNR